MKPIYIRYILQTILPATTLLLIAAGCQDSGVGPSDQTDADAKAKLQQVNSSAANALNTFSFDLLRRVDQAETKEPNLMVSPLSVHIALGMLLNGARGTTAQEISSTLGLGNMSTAEANQLYRNLIEGMPGVDPKVRMRIANSVWQDDSFPVSPAFSQTLQDYFRAQAFVLDLQSANAPSQINQWVSQQTEQRIQKIVEGPIGPDQVMFLINALYFKGDWKHQFEASRTFSNTFFSADGMTDLGEVEMMSQRLKLKVNRQEKFSAFELPYGQGHFNMVVLLPNMGHTVSEVLNGLNSNVWQALLREMRESEENIGLPKWETEYELSLNQMLQAMGIRNAFGGSADLSGISATGRLAVSEVRHKTFIKVNEEGTEAAAVTSIGIELTSAPVNPLFCNRPFAYLIYERNTGAVVFAGRFTRPQSAR